MLMVAPLDAWRILGVRPSALVFLKGSVEAVVRWRKIDNEERYRERIKREEWETILPELEFTGDRA